MARADRLIEHQEASRQAMYRDLGVEPLVMWFEDGCGNPDGAIASVAAYIGVTPGPTAAATVPEIRQQSQAGAREWAVRHQQSQS